MAKLTFHVPEPDFNKKDTIHKISTAESLEALDTIEDFLYNTRQINRKKKANRQMILELCAKITRRRYQLIDELCLVPF